MKDDYRNELKEKLVEFKRINMSTRWNDLESLFLMVNKDKPVKKSFARELHEYFSNNTGGGPSYASFQKNWREWTDPSKPRLPNRNYVIQISFLLEYTPDECSRLLELTHNPPLIIRDIEDAIIFCALNQKWTFKQAQEIYAGLQTAESTRDYFSEEYNPRYSNEVPIQTVHQRRYNKRSKEDTIHYTTYQMKQDILKVTNFDEALQFFQKYIEKLGRFNNSAREMIRTATGLLGKEDYIVSARLWDTYVVLSGDDSSVRSWDTLFSEMRKSGRIISRDIFILIIMISLPINVEESVPLTVKESVPLTANDINVLLIRCGFAELNAQIPLDFLVIQMAKYIYCKEESGNCRTKVEEFLEAVNEIDNGFVKTICVNLRRSFSSEKGGVFN